MAGKTLSCLILFLGLSSVALAQTTAAYHLHSESSATPGFFVIKPNGPDAAVLAVQSAELKGLTGERVVKEFETRGFDPNGTGLIPAGSTVTYMLWMKKTANAGTMFPRAKLYLNSATGTPFCTATGTTALTTTLTEYTFTCTTASAITMTSADQFYLWVGANITAGSGNTKVKAELDVEGTLNGNYDSQVIIPVPPASSIASLSPSVGPVGTSVTINGTNFGATQNVSKVSFNGVTATPTSWSNTAIIAPVPSGATTGPVVVTTGAIPSNGVTFTVGNPPPNISGLSPSTGPVGTSVTVSGSNFGATQGTSTIIFSGVTTTPSSWSAATIVAPVPSGATTGPVVVTVGGLSSNGVTFTVATTGTISGTITRASDGTVISGALVEALQSSVIKGTATTAANGTYSITGLTPGVYDVRASASGYVTQLMTGNSVVAGGTTTVNMALSLPPAITSLSPASGAVGTSVTVSGSSFNATQGASTVTFNGTAATPGSWSATSIVAPVPTGATTGVVVVTVGGVASNGVTFTVVTTGTISGTITRASGGTPINGALVEALQSNVAKASATTVADGSYSIGGLSAGTYDVRVSASSYGTELRTGISVVAAGTATVNVALSDPGTITGKVTQIDGTTPIAGATVKAFQAGTTMATATANATGDYAIAGLSAGTYTVQASAMGYEAKSQTGVAVASGSTTTLNLSLNTGSIVYIYDDVGRLAAAVDTGGDTAVYSYDAVGNLLSISRQSSSAVSVLGFSPNSGPVGASVTINGTGFSATAGDNTVKFNGVVATVNSASVTQIVASVPFGASTGAISVTAPTGSATSATVFTVTSAMGAPTITGFTPQVAKIGDAVTIAGTNFDTNPVNDKVTINLTGAQVGSATATSISTSVSSRTGSGKITVSTPAGSAVSNADFFVVPLSNPADVEFTSRMAIGESKVVTINTPGKAGAILFEGTLGQKVSLTATNVTISAAYVGIYDPYGATFGGQTTVSPNGGFIDGQTLIMNGTYMILVTASTGFSGSMTLTLNDARDAIGTITPGGPSVTVTTNIPGQNARYTFNGTAGQTISLKFTNSMIANGNGTVIIYSPDGAIWASFSNVSGGLFMDARTLPFTGTYTIVIDPYYTITGNIVTLTIYDITDVTGSITPGGASVTVTMSVPGQNARLTFGGAAGQKVSLNIASVTIVPHGSTASILNPDGSTLFSGTFGASGYFIDNLNLATAGTYTIVVDPNSDDLGSATLTLYDTPDVTGTITPGGASVPITITTPGQNARLTFTGNAGQKVSLNTSNVTIQFSNVTIYKPDATVLASGGTGMSGGFIDTQTLPASGTYTILVDPSSAYTGNITLTLYDVSDVTGTIAPGGSPAIVTIATPGQNATLTFNGTGGQKISLNMSGVTIVTSTVTIYKPDGTSLVSTSVGTNGKFIDTQTLPASGTYTILIDPSSSYTGNMTLTLWIVPPDVTGAITIGGQAATVTITTPGQNGQLTFAGTSGQQATVRIANSTVGCVTVSLLKPDGSVLTSTTYCANGSFNLATQTLPATGTYTIAIDPSLSNTGSMDVSVTSP